MPVAVRPRRAERDVAGRRRREPEAVALVVEITGVVERDRLEERAHAAVDLRRRNARPQHRGGIVRPRRRRDHEAGNVAQDGDRVVVVEVAAEALLVAVAGDPHHHPVAVLALREELQRRRLAAELILGVVEVGEVLDLGQRHEAGHRGAGREAEDRRLVEQRVEDAAGAEASMEAARDAVDAALGRDVLAEEERLGMPLERVCERAVDRERERQRLGHRLARGGVAACELGHGCRRAGGERPHHVGRALELRPSGGCERDARARAPGVSRYSSASRLPVRGPAATSHAAVASEGIVLEIGAHVGGRAVGGLDVGAGVTEVANGSEVEHRGTPRLAHPVGELARASEHAGGVVAVGALVADARPARERAGDPAGWRRDADPEAVVLAHEEQRHGQVLVRGVAVRVERGLRGGVVQRGVAEAADDDRVARARWT